jgi:predicted acetyltransferase
MTADAKVQPFPAPPDNLASGDVRLRFIQVVPGDASRGLVPSYQFGILMGGAMDVGKISFRVGDTEHVHICAGHIGYEVQERFRGHGFALHACRAIAPFVRSFYQSVIITCNPDNLASIRTLERLGAAFIDEVAVPPHDPHYKSGSRRKRRYRWTP